MFPNVTQLFIESVEQWEYAPFGRVGGYYVFACMIDNMSLVSVWVPDGKRIGCNKFTLGFVAFLMVSCL